MHEPWRAALVCGTGSRTRSVIVEFHPNDVFNNNGAIQNFVATTDHLTTDVIRAGVSDRLN